MGYEGWKTSWKSVPASAAVAPGVQLRRAGGGLVEPLRERLGVVRAADRDRQCRVVGRIQERMALPLPVIIPEPEAHHLAPHRIKRDGLQSRCARWASAT